MRRQVVICISGCLLEITPLRCIDIVSLITFSTIKETYLQYDQIALPSSPNSILFLQNPPRASICSITSLFHLPSSLSSHACCFGGTLKDPLIVSSTPSLFLHCLLLAETANKNTLFPTAVAATNLCGFKLHS